MARYDSHVRRLEKRLKHQETKRVSGNIAKALKEFTVTGELPKHPGLKRAVLQFQEAAREMVGTLPDTPVSLAPPHPGKIIP